MSNDSTHISDTVEKHFFRASAADFKKIPGSPIAYWIAEKLGIIYSDSNTLNQLADSIQGMITGDNNKFLRRWYEVNRSKLSLDKTAIKDVNLEKSFWIPYNKGGDLRKWYGNNEFVLNWKNEGRDLIRSRTQNAHFYFKPCITWTFISSAFFAARNCDVGFVWDVAGSSAFPHDSKSTGPLLCLMCSKVGKVLLDAINPTLNYQVENILALPVHVNIKQKSDQFNNFLCELLPIGQLDWDSYETSWNFVTLPLLQDKFYNSSINITYTQLRAHWQEMTLETQRLEQESNRIFIDAYGLQDELTSEVPLKEITLTCNPHYRYGNNKTDAELEALLLADTLKEFISYAVGCMFGRYALDKPGLILANQGETLADYLKQIPEPIFCADDDNVIPMLDGDWFTDDVTERFGKFLKVTFGEAHYEENLKYIEQALGKDIRKYFLKDFYNDHLKRYKKRPIYWLFSSPKGTFNALIYLHRYRSDTVSVVLNDYLREFRAKLSAHKVHLEAVSISGSASASEKTKALKDIENHRKMLDELDTYEREVLYPLATEQLEIDLDDGVKVNYQKFGDALKKIPGLAAKDD